MKSYDPKEWKKLIFDLPKADTLRQLVPVLLVLGIYSGVLAFIELHYFSLSLKNHLRNLSLMHTLLGFVLSLLLVFRTNTAYDRWWEGRKLWGALVNNSRNLALKINSLFADDKDIRTLFATLIPDFATELKNHLQAEQTRYSLDEAEHPEIANFSRINHIPNQIVAQMINRLTQLQAQQKISGEQLLFINPELSSFMDICGGCERIKNTPIPYSYSSFIKKFILVYTITLPLDYVYSLHYLIIPVVIFILYVLASLELIAEEIEDPFRKDDYAIPMERIAENIQKNVVEILS